MFPVDIRFHVGEIGEETLTELLEIAVDGIEELLIFLFEGVLVKMSSTEIVMRQFGHGLVIERGVLHRSILIGLNEFVRGSLQVGQDGLAVVRERRSVTFRIARVTVVGNIGIEVGILVRRGFAVTLADTCTGEIGRTRVFTFGLLGAV